MRYLLLAQLFIFTAFGIIDIASVDFGEKEEGLSGSLYGSFQKKRGNTNRDESEYGGRIQYDTQKSITWLQGSLEHDKSNDTTTDDNAFLHLRHIHQVFNPFWALEFYGQLKKDSFKNLQQRGVVGMGPRVKLVDSKEYGKLFFGLSLMDEQIRYTENAVDENEHNLRMSSYLSYKTKVNENFDFSLMSYYQPKIDKGSDYLATALAEMTIHLSKVIDLSYLLEFDYDSRPPSTIVRTDVRQRLSFAYRFGKDEPIGASMHSFLKSNEEEKAVSVSKKKPETKATIIGVWQCEKESLALLEDGTGSYTNEASPYIEKFNWTISSTNEATKVLSVHFVDEEGRSGRSENYLFNTSRLIGLSSEAVKVFTH